MVVTIRKIGNSRGIVIPYQILERLGLEENDELDIVEVKDGIDIRIRKKRGKYYSFCTADGAVVWAAHRRNCKNRKMGQ